MQISNQIAVNIENTYTEQPSWNLDALNGTDQESWLAALNSAISATDEGAIWEIMHGQQHNDEARDVLASLVSRLAFSHENSNIHCELFMLPVISHPTAEITNNNAIWKSVRETAIEALLKWFPRDNKLVVFEGILPMDWISTWTPKVLRGHLERLLPSASSNSVVSFETESIDLPIEAPRLGFITMACSRKGDWPGIPDADTQRDHRLKNVLKFALQISTPAQGNSMSNPPTVLTPERVQYAITDGVALWLTQLHDAVGIEGYAVMPSGKAADVVKITLKLNSESVPYTQFALRHHQIGNQGLQDILGLLQSTAKNLEIPSDMSAAQVKQYLQMQS